MFFGKVNSTSFNTVKNRIVKFLALGGNDTRNYPEAGPYGLDSNPIPGTFTIFEETGNGAPPVAIGYININQKAAVGEMRIYSTDTDGNLKASGWCKADGTFVMNEGTSPAVLGDKNKQALTDAYNLLDAIKTFANACTASTDPALAAAATALNTFMTANMPTFQTDINATNSENVKLN